MVYNNSMDYLVRAEKLLPLITKLRRFLHACPEKSGAEHNTSEFIYNTLCGWGYSPRYIKTGVVADIKGTLASKTIALRADIDALPIKENTGAMYASQNALMHACGHDGHTALLLSVAKSLTQEKPLQNVRLIFQFGEEGEGGAAQMIEEGAAEGISEIYAVHVSPDLQKGSLSTCKGAMFAGAAEITVEFFGKSAHCAQPEKGADAIKSMVYFLAQADKINNVYNGRALFHTGKIDGGLARNIIADSASAFCSLRYFDAADLEQIKKKLKDILDECGKKFKVKSDLNYLLYRPLINSSAIVDKLKKLDPDILDCKPLYTAEDFGEFTRQVPGCMLWLGIKDEKHSSPLHSDTFDFDESALIKGAELFLKIVNQE